jgi:hypothetical protein
MLDEDWSRKNPGKNFFGDEIACYAAARVRRVSVAGGTAEADRLQRNLLSSMPLCFNLFGFLRQHASIAAAALGEVLDLPMMEPTVIEVEWSPEPHPLGDRTAFDAYVESASADGDRGFLGVETKYTEKFSQREYERARYVHLTEAPGSGFRPGAAERLAGTRTNQLWRNALLALAHREAGFQHGLSVVLHAAGDTEIGSAVDAFYAERAEPGSLLRVVTYEDLIDAIGQHSAARGWSEWFRGRYLDLSPIR